MENYTVMDVVNVTHFVSFTKDMQNKTLISISEDLESKGSSLLLLNKISQVVEGYIFPLIFLFGIFGNTLSFVVFIWSRNTADASLQYLAFLAVADTGVILTLGLEHWLTYGLDYITGGAVSLSMFTNSDFWCKFLSMILHVFECTSAWLIMTFSLERAYIVWYPLKRSYITQRRRLTIIIMIVLLTICFSIHRLVLLNVYVESDVDGGTKWCFYTVTPALGFWIYQWDTGMHNYVPIPLIITANIAILIGINRAKHSFNSKMKTTHKTKQETRVVLSLFLVSTFYIIFMLPASVSFSSIVWLFR
jgi:hypothetical protein